ncbi:flagellar motor stator protein MotA [Pullulanibacillus sp. KACC 23026]|uniref:flagellar motor stator protein MotA n=1 Tax=Pullulanibacillus sp. KACC 23026 TaxID=3028315 RepID=UPI0023B1EA3E|nr:flagellar motor stator protein MotA [Pullulanibacillus sp. KACC 23026]WEG11270.1 flagellar motor stator protein MotA [Pullulanibacillus sp. KACC 23026]
MSSILGILLALLAVGLAMVLKGASLSALYNPAAYIIIFGGTAAAVLIAFPFNEIKKFPALIKIALFQPKLPSKANQITSLVQCAEVAKKEGLLALEEIANTTEDPFFKNGLELIIDGNDIEFIEEVLLDEVAAIDKRHKTGALIFSQAGTYAPTLGVLGAVIGLIASLGNLNNVTKLGHSISAAFIATLLGIFSGYVLWHPIANRLKRISKQEQEAKLLIIEGLISIYQGLSPTALEKKLSIYIPPKERLKNEKKNKVETHDQTA